MPSQIHLKQELVMSLRKLVKNDKNINVLNLVRDNKENIESEMTLHLELAIMPLQIPEM